MRYKLLKTPEYKEWLSHETKKSQAQIENRLSKIESEGHFGITKFLDNEICELKWDNGRRLYYAFIPEANIIIIRGEQKWPRQRY